MEFAAVDGGGGGKGSHGPASRLVFLTAVTRTPQSVKDKVWLVMELLSR